MVDAVVVSAVRSPIGRAVKGSLAQMRPDDLAAQVIAAALKNVPQLDPHGIDDLVLGCGLPGGEAGFNIGRVVAVQLGLDSLPATTVNRYCASSLQALRMAFHAIKAGEGDSFVCAGVETVSRFSYGTSDSWPDTQNPLFAGAIERTSQSIHRPDSPWSDPRADGLMPNVYIGMGQTAENVALAENVSRDEMDRFSVRSHRLAVQAQDNGFWEREITPVQLPDGSWMSRDDGPRREASYQVLSGLEPVFQVGGRVTAGNSCPLNDGAAALVVVSDKLAQAHNMKPLARIVATAVSGISPEIMGLGPIEASRRALALAGMSVGDIDVFEINEAFAAQVLPVQRELGIDMDRLNINGGAIAIGHPFGMTGARIATTLINTLQANDQQFGLETMCVGGGQGMAMVLERLS